MSTALLEKDGATAEFLYGGPAFLSEQAADPATLADVGSLYGKDDAGVTEAFYKNSAGQVVKITQAGTVVGFTVTSTDSTATLPILTTTSATRAAVRIGSLAGDPSTLADGDTWYNTTAGKFRGRQAGASIDLGGASGWTDDGTVIRLTTSSDVVSVGSTSDLGKFFVGSTDATAIVIRGRGTTSQAGNLLQLESVTPTTMFTVSNIGNVAAAGTLSLSGGSLTFTVGSGGEIASTSTYDIVLVPGSGKGVQVILAGTNSDAFKVQVVGNKYIQLDTTVSPVTLSFGNVATNPNTT